ncbi:hypothetical protein TorRG33x02_247920 [Trema orientale]|uniref:Uncharacterized protein n=1 Tax=Trema orientale TaxID=63057 RepID=A0A2P5DL74_TREOI|nr:hypothetical protein TorRG33x02_247920 [Trema orientale]
MAEICTIGVWNERGSSDSSPSGYILSELGQPNGTVPPRDKIFIPGDGNPKGILSN